MEKSAVFPLFYLPNVEFFKNLLECKDLDIFIEKYEHFPKQTFRNRAVIAGPNGKLDLTVPVKKGNNLRTVYQDMMICNDFNWQRNHWLSIQTNYRSSAYFEFYEDYFAPFYHKKYNYLFDYNLELLTTIFKLLKIQPPILFTQDYQKQLHNSLDFRNSFSAKQPSKYQNKPYFQVFEDKIGYLNNLSIIDVLFNQGPQASKFF
jgi:hypothetical protein